MTRAKPETLAALRRRVRRILFRYERLPLPTACATGTARAEGVRVALRWVLWQTPTPTNLMHKWLQERKP